MPDERTRLVGKRLTSTIVRLAPGRLLIVNEGYDDGENVNATLREFEREIARSGELHAFVDASRQSGFAFSAREDVASWLKTNRASMRSAHVLFRSKVLEMAITLINVFTGDGLVTAHSSVERFEEAIARATPGFRRLPKLDGAA